jgi:hypothetical protein
LPDVTGTEEIKRLAAVFDSLEHQDHAVLRFLDTNRDGGSVPRRKSAQDLIRQVRELPARGPHQPFARLRSQTRDK